MVAPFVLLDDATPEGPAARLYRAPVEVIEARSLEAVRPALDAVRAGVARGLNAAGFLAYEAGSGIEPRIAAAGMPAEPLVWFGLFEGFETIARDDLPAWLPDPRGAWAAPPEPLIDRTAYDAQLARALELIAAGDIYQANLTFAAEVRFAGDPLALYARLRGQARAGYGAVIATGAETILSLSPELFFRLDGDRLLARPMKGTATRRASADADRAALKQPDDLKRVYDAAFDKLVTAPVQAMIASDKALLVVLDSSDKIAGYASEHRTKLTISGSQIRAADARTQAEFNALILAHQDAQKRFQEAQRNGDRVVNGR